MQQIVIDIPPELYVTPEIIEGAKEFVRDGYFNALLALEDANDYEKRLEQLITEDDEPVDNIFSERQQKILTETLYASWKPMTKTGEPRTFFAAANIGLYGKFEYVLNPIVPDVLVSLDVTAPTNVHEKRHRSYMIWEFGKPPDLVLEIVSNKKGNELNDKMSKYAKLAISYYVVFDPTRFLSDDVLRVYEKSAGNGYELREDFSIPALDLKLTIHKSTFEGIEDDWLSWTDYNGEVLPTSQEVADEEKRRADEEMKRANDETKRADKSENRAAKLAEKLRELGINPNDI
ncbi:MAG: Uma2 family endonuclease [Pyrinomonadaceae bacterium]|nr:Uma2 family endonuclease [Pyrinomonadaceae bacterium]